MQTSIPRHCSALLAVVVLRFIRGFAPSCLTSVLCSTVGVDHNFNSSAWKEWKQNLCQTQGVNLKFEVEEGNERYWYVYILSFLCNLSQVRSTFFFWPQFTYQRKGIVFLLDSSVKKMWVRLLEYRTWKNQWIETVCIYLLPFSYNGEVACRQEGTLTLAIMIPIWTDALDVPDGALVWIWFEGTFQVFLCWRLNSQCAV